MAADPPYPIVHAAAIVGTTLAIYGALGVAFHPVYGPVPGSTTSRFAGGLALAIGATLVAWALGENPNAYP